MNKITKRLDSNVGAAHQGQINPFLVSAEEQTSIKYKPRIWGSIEGTEDFMYVVDVLETAREQDTVEIHISSNGGDVDATSTLIHAMQKCDATVHVVMTGVCASCGTLPMFYADSWEAGEFTSFMFHDFILGLPPQTMSATKAMTEHYYKSCESMIRRIYDGFFTEEELSELFSGKTFWMQTDEVVERFKRRDELTAQEENPDETPIPETSSCSCGMACSKSNNPVLEN